MISGLIAGSLDIIFACVFWAIKAQVPVIRIFQSVARGLLGASSFDGGAGTAALGLVLHFLIAIAMAAAYILTASRLDALWKQPLLFGCIYGGFLYLFMNFVVIPLSAASRGSADPLWIVLSVLVHMLFVGVPIALFAKRAFAPRE